MTALTNNEIYEKIDKVIEKMTEEIMKGTEEGGCIVEEDVNALARLIEARAKL